MSDLNGTPNRPACLNGHSLDVAFPFFLLLDADLIVLTTGSAWAHTLPQLAAGQPCLSHLSVDRPKGLLSSHDWLQFEHEPLVLHALCQPEQRFRGQISRQEGGRILLLLSPVINRFEDLKHLHINLAQLAPHDATGDMLMLNKIAQTSFNDAQKMATRLRQRSQQLELMTELSGNGVAYISPSGDVQQCNPRLASLLEWPDMSSSARSIDQIEKQLQSIAVASHRNKINLQSLTPPSQDALTDTTGVVVPTTSGRFLKVSYVPTEGQAHVLFLRDVTTETTLDRMKSEFMSTAAHELRTPMTSIYGFSELLIDRDLAPEKAQRLAQTIHRQAGWMVGLLNKLLDLARIEARQGQDFEIVPLDVCQIMEDVLTSYCDNTNRARVDLQSEQPCPSFLGDRIKATQAIGNVLSNALKYSPAGGPVSVRLSRTSRQAVQGLQIVIRDQGLGMTPEQLSHVFERFYRADPSCNIPGSGLGMSLVQQIMRLHDGSIELQSEYGKGTEVSLWFPSSSQAEGISSPI